MYQFSTADPAVGGITAVTQHKVPQHYAAGYLFSVWALNGQKHENFFKILIRISDYNPDQSGFQPFRISNLGLQSGNNTNIYIYILISVVTGL